MHIDATRQDPADTVIRMAHAMPHPPQWDTILHEPLSESARRRRRAALATTLVGILVMLIGAIIIGVPLVERWQAAHTQSQVVDTSKRTVDGWPYPQAEEHIAAARAYNRRLAASGQHVLGEAADQFTAIAGESNASDDDTSQSSQDHEYQSLLDTGSGVMGAIRIPKISVNLPILHGTSGKTLEQGAGHLYGTSLPVGGPSTHSVITGHRGLVEALMFTRLDEMRVGDLFYIDVMGKEFGYKVDRISVIEPDDSRLLRITPGEVRVTLMTCTPYGVNTHRLLVSGVRARIPQDIPASSDGPKDARTIAAATTISIGAMGIIVCTVARRRPHPMGRHISQ